MRRTFIVTIETEGSHEHRTMGLAESDLLDHCDSVGNSYPECSVLVEICVDPVPDEVISELCNSGAASRRESLGSRRGDGWRRAMEALRLVYELAEGNSLSESEADTEELMVERARQEEALQTIYDYLNRPDGSAA